MLRLVGPALCAICVTACPWSDRLDSEPSAWSPPPQPLGQTAPASLADDAGPVAEGGANANDGGVRAEAGAVDCDDDPPFDSALQASMASGQSHRAGQACLTGCHEQGGSAQLVLAAAGTIYRSQGSHDVAGAGGTVQQVGNTTLTLDGCGNFYAVSGALATGPNQTQPVVQNPALHQMLKILYRESQPGNCNQSGCHDFSSSANLGIYY